MNYHLKNRDASESAPCTITLMESGILAEIPEFELTYNYSWDDFTTIYDKFGYYMFFEKGKMTVMLRQADVLKHQFYDVVDFIKKNVNQNICRVLF